MSSRGGHIPLDPRFAEAISEQLGGESEGFVQAIEGKPSTSIFMNPGKPVPDLFPRAGSVPWSSKGYFLEERPSFTFDPLFHAGTYYVQEASSMFLEHIIRQTVDPHEAIIALDLCAAPGGKSTLMLSSLPDGSLLVANEVIRSRWEVLQYNLDKWGASNVISTNSDPTRLSWDRVFDLVLVDAPCSGEGLFRKDPQARLEWSPQNVELCSARQRRILPEAVRLLKPGGTIVYSTCTFNPTENINQVRWLANEFGLEGLEIEIRDEWGIDVQCLDGLTGYQFWPHRVRSEGFFCSILRKPDHGESATDSRFRKKKTHSPEKFDATFFIDLGSETGKAYTYLSRGRVSVLQTSIDPEVLGDIGRYRVGTMIGENKGGNFVPSHALALSKSVSTNWASVEVDEENAIQFLRKETPVLDLTPGWHLVKYKGHGLGWVKQTPSGLRNYLPTHLRIRSQG